MMQMHAIIRTNLPPNLVLAELKMLTVVENIIQRKLAAQISNGLFLDIDILYVPFSSSYFHCCILLIT